MQPTSKKTVTKMREEYEKTIRKTSTENLKKKFPDRPWIEEAISTWLSRKELEALLDANHADGLRIYYGCHPKSTHSDPKRDYLGLHNLIFVATKDSINPADPKTETSVDQLRDITTSTSTTEITTDVVPTNYDGNAGELTALCPPSCPTP